MEFNRLRWLLMGVVLIGLMSTTFGQSQDQKRRDALSKTIEEFEINRTNNDELKNTEVLFIGSSSFLAYKGFEEDYRGLSVLNLGFGGSQLSDVLYFFDKLVEPYDPKQIIVYEGDNDLASGLTVDEFMNDVRAFVRLVQIRKPGTHISFLTPKPSPARRHLTSSYEEANRSLYEYAIASEGVDFIDISQPMYQRDGKIRPEIWTADSLHMNRIGYETWGPIIRSYIRQ